MQTGLRGRSSYRSAGDQAYRRAGQLEYSTVVDSWLCCLQAAQPSLLLVACMHFFSALDVACAQKCTELASFLSMI